MHLGASDETSSTSKRLFSTERLGPHDRAPTAWEECVRKLHHRKQQTGHTTGTLSICLHPGWAPSMCTHKTARGGRCLNLENEGAGPKNGKVKRSGWGVYREQPSSALCGAGHYRPTHRPRADGFQRQSPLHRASCIGRTEPSVVHRTPTPLLARPMFHSAGKSSSPPQSNPTCRSFWAARGPPNNKMRRQRSGEETEKKVPMRRMRWHMPQTPDTAATLNVQSARKKQRQARCRQKP